MFWKSYFQIHIFSWHLKKWLKSAIFDKTSSGGAKRRYSWQLKWNSNWKNTLGKKCNLKFLSKIIFLVVFSRWKRNKFQISMKFDFKNGKSNFETLISPSVDELHCSTIVHMNHMEHMFQDLSFYCTKMVPKKNTINFFTFVTGVELTSCWLLIPWFRVLNLLIWYSSRSFLYMMSFFLTISMTVADMSPRLWPSKLTCGLVCMFVDHIATVVC